MIEEVSARSEYSQKLIKVLTHEIMNSFTPIISLTKLIDDRLVDEKTGELTMQNLASDEQHDLARGLARSVRAAAGCSS